MTGAQPSTERPATASVVSVDGVELPDPATVQRPGPLQWLRYVWTGRVPERSHTWVLHDVTSRSWVLRHAARFMVQLIPVIVLVVVLLPAAWPIRLGCVVVGVLASVVFSFGYTVEGAERRVEKAGYPFGIAGRLRERRAIDAQMATAARQRARTAARRERAEQRRRARAR